MRRRLAYLILVLLAVTAVLAWYAVWRPRVAQPRAAAANANLVICVIDAARPDHMGCYGYARDTTPNIDRLARDSLVFEQHFTQAAFTKGSTASLFTSQYPDTHLVFSNEGGRGIKESSFTMARGLGEAGFHTVFFSSDPWLDVKKGMGRDFREAYGLDDVTAITGERGQRFAPEPLLYLFGKWLGGSRPPRFFAYLHIMAPHVPYAQPEQFTALFRGAQPPGYRPDKHHPGEYAVPIGHACTAHPPLPEWLNLYDANMRYADWAVGQVEALLREAGLFRNTLLIVTSDHGEAFGEHGYVLHGASVYDETSHIPLVIRFPRRAPRGRIAALTQTIDLLPTILEIFGVRYPQEGIQGRSLVPLIAGRVHQVNDYVFTRGQRDLANPADRDACMTRSRSHALLLYANGKWRALYDLKDDPEEQHDVLAAQPAIAKSMLDVFRAFAMRQRRPPVYFLDPGAKPPPMPTTGERGMTPERKRELRALGYLK